MIVAQRAERMMGLRIVDIYFPDEIYKVQFTADIGIILQSATPIPRVTPFTTLKIDLRNESDEILSDMSKTNRYEIRRADKDDPVHTDINTSPTHEEINGFADFFDGYFALHKDLTPCNRNRLRSLCKQGGLALTQAKHNNGELLVAHANVIDHQGGRTRLLYSASYYGQIESSSFRQLIGRANRLLHWKEMLHFKYLGFHWYDFGGIGGPESNEKQQSIAQFKLGFGGEECIEYNAVIGKTILGKTALAARKLIKI